MATSIFRLDPAITMSAEAKEYQACSCIYIHPVKANAPM